MFVFCETLGAYGGSHTLILRMCRWLTENRIRSAVIASSLANSEMTEKLKKNKTKIICADVENTKQIAKVFRFLQKKGEIKAISFNRNTFFAVEKAKLYYKIRFDSFIYGIHPSVFACGGDLLNPLLRNVYLAPFRRIYRRINHNHAMFFMDEEVTEATCQDLGVDIRPPIVRIAVEFPDRDDIEQLISKGFHSPYVMAASRASFPFKGYLIALINDFISLKKLFPGLKLLLVSDGDDIVELEDKIKEAPDDIRKDIRHFHWLSYEDLAKAMESCKVFVGMGTTVIEAARVYRPSVVVKDFTYGNISDHLLGERPEYLSTRSDDEPRAFDQIKKVLSMDFKTYREHVLTSYDRIKAVYDADLNMQKIVHASTTDGSPLLTRLECAYIKANAVRAYICHPEFRGKSAAADRYEKITREEFI